MKNFTSKLLLTVAMLVGGASFAWADAHTVSLTQSTLNTMYPNNEVANYFDFVSMAKEWNDASTDDKANYELTSGTTTIKVNNIAQYQISVPSSMSMFYVQAVGTSNGFQWRWDTSRAKYGLMNFGNARTLAIAVTEGQIIVMEGGYTSTATGSCDATYDSKDGYNTFKATENGYIAFSTRAANIRALAILNPSATAVNYTVKYVDENGDEIKTSTTGEGNPGDAITITSAEKASFLSSDETKKYIYKSDDSEGKTIASDGTTVVTITFREAAKYTYSVVDNLSNVLASGSAFEGDDVDFYVPYFVFKDEKFYKSPSLSSGTLSYGTSTISAIAENTNITVTYDEEANTTVVFFSEAENLTGITEYEDNFTHIRMSNGKAGYFAAKTEITTLPAGYYTLTSSTRMGTTTFFAGETEIGTMQSSGAVEVPTFDFNVTENTAISASAGSSSSYFDYVIIRKAIASITPAADMTTYVTTIPLDFSGVAGLNAYVATAAANGSVTLTEVDAVPAATPLVLIGTAGTEYTVPAATSATDPATNLLKAGDGTATFDGSTYDYILKDGLFHKISSGTVATTKAYLHCESNPEASEARPLTINFEGQTGINTVKAEEFTGNGGIYNLQGQPVAQPAKGLYIMNGKKVIVK